MAAATDVSLTLTVAGPLEAFDADAQATFKSNFAAQLDGISPSDITLQVSAASVRVVAAISAPSEAVATAALSDLTELASSADALSAALKVTVEAVEAAPAMVEGVAQSQDTTQSGSGGSGGIAVVIGAAGGGILLVLLIGLVVRRKRRAGTEGAPVYSTSASGDTSEIDLESSNRQGAST